MNTKNKKANQIILLNGKSVRNIKDYKIQDNDTIYAVNRKSAIEDLLKSQNRNADVWIVTSALDFIELYDEILEFLSRKQDNKLITALYTLQEVKHLLEIKPLPNPNKIILIDNVDKIIDSFTSDKGLIPNTLSRLLAVLLISNQYNILLFGCDGVQNQDSKDIYFDQKNLSKERMNRNAIHRDMIYFDKYYQTLINTFCQNKKDLFILNLNKNSFYQSIPKGLIQKSIIPNNNSIKFILDTHLYTNKDLIQLIMQYETLKINSFLYKKAKTSFIKKIKSKFKSKN